MAPLFSGPASATTFAQGFPPYLANTHAQLLFGGDVDGSSYEATNEGAYGYNAKLFIEQAIDDNPYVFAEAYDIEPELEEVREKITAFATLLEDYLTSDSADGSSGANQMQLTENFLTKAAALFTSLDVEADIDFDDLSADTLDEYTRVTNQFDASMYNINAITTSPYVIGLTNLENGRQRVLARFAAELRRQLIGGRLSVKGEFLIRAASLMDAMVSRDATLAQTLVALQSDLSRVAYVGKKEKLQQDIEYDVGEVTWELEALKYRAEFMQAIGNVPQLTRKPSQISTAISTALSVGPQIGMAIGQIGGPAAGFAAGGIGALLAGFAAFNS